MNSVSKDSKQIVQWNAVPLVNRQRMICRLNFDSGTLPALLQMNIGLEAECFWITWQIVA
jgi:hypothetical protein